MEPIYIPQLAKAPEQTEEIQVQDYLSDLATLTPVQGTLVATHRGSYIEVSAKAEAIMTLTCDRCLQQYNYRVTVDTSELIWLQEVVETIEDAGIEKEVPLDDLVETLSPQGYFYPSQWLYEQFCLAMPQRQLCDLNCQGIQIAEGGAASSQAVDRRWASLETLKDHLRN